MKINDIVKIIVLHPDGCDNYNVLNNVGVIIDIDKTDNEVNYCVRTKNTDYGDCFWYNDNQITVPFDDEIKEAFVNLLKR